MMKKFLKFVAVLGVLAAIGIGAVFYFSSGMVASADRFFVAIQAGDLDTAYGQLSRSFQATTSREDLGAYVEHNRLQGYQESTWGSRSLSSASQGVLSGIVTTSERGTVPVTMTFVKEDGDWKIYSLVKPAAGLTESVASIEIPDEATLIGMARRANLVFAESVKARSMAAFHASVSNLWQGQSTVADLDRIFDPFYQFGADLTILQNLTPQFTATPNVDEQGVLLVQGVYPTRPSRFTFEQKYVYEGLGWKLLGYSANLQP